MPTAGRGLCGLQLDHSQNFQLNQLRLGPAAEQRKQPPEVSRAIRLRILGSCSAGTFIKKRWPGRGDRLCETKPAFPAFEKKNHVVVRCVASADGP